MNQTGIRTEPTNSVQEVMQLLFIGVNFDIKFIDFELPIISRPQFVMDMNALGIQSTTVDMLSNLRDHNSEMFLEAEVNGNTQKTFIRGILNTSLKSFASYESNVRYCYDVLCL
ncbi:unnamed protein product [Lathyrus sativus]|nr:unnamed protein product [Lathyrus sativus]